MLLKYESKEVVNIIVEVLMKNTYSNLKCASIHTLAEFFIFARGCIYPAIIGITFYFLYIALSFVWIR